MRLVLFSGGVDSTTALFWSKKECATHALIFKYPSLHNKREIDAAVRICKDEHISYTLLDMSSVFVGFKSALLQNSSESIPQDSYNLDSYPKF